MKPFLAFVVAFVIATGAFAGDTWSLVVCHSNDVHGGIDSSKATFMNAEFPPELGGGASAAALVDYMREYCHQIKAGFLLLDTGDIFQGTLVGSKTHGDAVVRYMNDVGYDAWVFGNHEFDMGRTVVEKLEKEATFSVLAANVMDTTGGVRKLLAHPYMIKDYGVMKVGIIGITTTATTRMAFKENISNLEFLPEVTTLAAYRDTLRAKGVDIIIAAVHLGLPFDRWQAWDELEKADKEGWKSDYAKNAFELARRVSGIDIIMAGDIHVGYQEPWVDPVTHTPCFQGYGRGTNLLAVQFDFDLATKKLVGWQNFQDEGALITLLSERFPRERKIATDIDSSVARVETGFNDRIGEAIIPITRTGEGESLMGNLVCDAMLWKLKGDISITNKGGVRTDLPAGILTPHHVFNVMPFDNTLGSVNISGKFLKDLLEEKVAYGGSGLYVGGMKVKVDKSKPKGERVITLEVGGKPYSPDSTYRLITSDYLLEGNSGMEKLASLRSQAAIETGVFQRDAIIEYIKEHSPIEPKLDGRWQTIGD